MNNEPRFIVDTMLGTVARWLRILGYDTVYDKSAEDWQIIRRAELEKRIIVTRDRGLHIKAIKSGLKSILLWEDDMPDRLAHIALVSGIQLGIDFNRTRCPEDNTILVKAEKEKIKSKVPPGVYSVHNDFWECPRCGKVYWIGNHWRQIEKILKEARDKLEILKVKSRL
ncbi:MAG: Mut7-C RNAse domain-containing protein [Desulfurococcaceae archaeon]